MNSNRKQYTNNNKSRAGVIQRSCISSSEFKLVNNNCRRNVLNSIIQMRWGIFETL